MSIDQRTFDLDQHSNPSKKSWFAVYTGAQQEKKLASVLDKKKINYYLPLVKKRRAWTDRIKIIEEPLLKGYLFVEINWLFDRVSILQLPGAVGFVKLNDLPILIHPSVIHSLELLVTGSEDVKVDPYAGFPPGQKVMIESGPFKGFDGFVKKVNSKTNIMVVIEALGQVISGSFNPQDIGPI